MTARRDKTENDFLSSIHRKDKYYKREKNPLSNLWIVSKQNEKLEVKAFHFLHYRNNFLHYYQKYFEYHKFC